MITQRMTRYFVCGLLAMLTAAPAVQAIETLPDSKDLMRALVDEIERSLTLQMEDLEKPYFIQYTVSDSITYRLTAAYGDLTASDRDRSRDFYSRVRVGSYKLDNTNFSGASSPFAMFFGGGGGGGGRASLPLDDDYEALRQAIWWATDGDYKDAVETLTKKQAYMKDKNLQDRPNDFTKGPVVQQIEPTAEFDFNLQTWEDRLRRISARFREHPPIQDSGVQLYCAAGNTYVVNTEGTRLRTADTGLLLLVTAELQAEDGMKVSDGLSYYGRSPNDLPDVDKVLADIDQLAVKLTEVAKAPILERYTGPVLFDNTAAAQMIRHLVAEPIAGRVEPVGTSRASTTGAGSLEKKLGQRILPSSFQVYDDPTVEKLGEQQLFGHYRYDDDGVPAERADLVKDGKLEALVMSRVPTKKLTGTNGHARSAPGSGTPEAAIANLFIEDEDGISSEELKAQLIEAAQDEGLEFGLLVASVRTAGLGSSQQDLISMLMRAQQRGGQMGLGDPIYAYKVYPDGREELVRGLEFGQIKLRDLKHILAGGDTPEVYNYIGVGFGGATPATAIIAPAMLFEELELSKIEQEHDKRPILATPLKR